MTLNIRCPHCHQPIELVEDKDPSGDVTCSSCGSRFNLAKDVETLTDDGKDAKMLGQFQLLHRLGQGAFGTVWKARDTNLERTVAVKIPRADRMSADDAEKFLREARAAAQVRHPNIVSVFEVGREDGQIYIASDFIEGASLDEWIEAQPPTVREAVDLCAKIAEALHEAHEAGVVHRDLKPQNILMDMSGEPHVTDFGLAKRDAAEVTMTVEGAILGTPAYMPPEQARGEAHKADRRSDVYTLGVILYRLLTGELPFRGRSQMLMVQILKDEPPAPRKLDARLPRDVETICLKCLEKDPARRYQTSADLAADLTRWLTGHPIHARPVSTLERSWRWCRRNPALAGMWTAASLLLLTLAIGGTLFAIQQASIATAQTKNAAKQGELRGKAEDERKIAERNAYNSDMLLAQRDWDDANIGHLRELLDRYRDRDDLTGFEWGYWNRLMQSDLFKLSGHTDRVNSIAFGPNGAFLVSASDDNTVKVWNLATAQEVLTFNGHSNAVKDVAFSPDGTRLASASVTTNSDLGEGEVGDDEYLGSSTAGQVKVWELATGQETLTLKGHTDEVTSVAFSPDGTRLASAGNDSTVKIWDLATGQEALTLKFVGFNNHVNSVAFSPDGTQLASAEGSPNHAGKIRLWDTATGQQIQTLKGHTSWVTSVVFSSGGARVASADLDGTVKVWDSASGQEKLTFKGRTGPVRSIAFSPNGLRLASGGGEEVVTVWDVNSGKEIISLKGDIGTVFCVAYSPDGTRLVSAGDETICVWSAISRPETLTSIGHIDGVRRVAISPDGRQLASASGDDGVKVWDASTGREVLSLTENKDDFSSSVAFSPDGRRLATATWNGTVKVWDAATWKQTLTFNADDASVNSVAFSPDGTRLATAANHGELKVWDAATGKVTLMLKGHDQEVKSVVFSPDGKRLASACGTFDVYGITAGEVKVWDVATAQEIFTFKGHSHAVFSVAFSPDGTRLASASGDESVKVWNAATGEELLTLNGHTSSVTGVAFSPDGQRVVTASLDGTVKVWDAETGQETLTLNGHTSGVNGVAFSSDGQRLVTASFDGTVKVWDGRPWTPELKAEFEARGLLTVKRDRMKSLEELQADIRDDKTINNLVRKQALDWSELFWKNRKSDSE